MNQEPSINSNSQNKLNVNIKKILSEKKDLEEFIESHDKIRSFQSEGNFILCKFRINFLYCLIFLGVILKL